MISTLEDEAFEKQVKDAIDSIIDVNNRCTDELVGYAIYEALQGSHRTLQASFIRSLQFAIKLYGEQESFDLRNQGAVKWAKEVTKVTINIPYI